MLLEDFADRSKIAQPDVDLFDFANRILWRPILSAKRPDYSWTTKGLKTAFVVPFSETEGRLDPPFYLWRSQASRLLTALSPLGDTIRGNWRAFQSRKRR